MKVFKDKILVITGGTGSFGHAVLQRILREDFGEIRIFSRDEKKQEDLRLSLDDDRVKFIVGDVRDYNSISDAMRGAHFAFHAAALKQVPSCEFYPIEAVRTNVLGAENTIRAALSNKLERCVLLSTDKAVYPVNAMGMSKAMMEKIMAAQARFTSRGDTIISATRYGNVMASRGSVIPLFVNQLKSGKPMTITEPGMTRFLMSLADSVELVLYAFRNAEPGDIFVQKSPASTVGDLAVAVAELLEKPANIEIIGTRHGEKLYESLVSREEMARAIDLEHYYRIPADNRDLNYRKYFSEGQVPGHEVEDYTSHNTVRLTVPQVKEKLLSLSYMQEVLAHA